MTEKDNVQEFRLEIDGHKIVIGVDVVRRTWDANYCPQPPDDWPRSIKGCHPNLPLDKPWYLDGTSRGQAVEKARQHVLQMIDSTKFVPVTIGLKKEPPNNDGRTTCYWCNGSIKSIQGFNSTYDICEKCKK